MFITTTYSALQVISNNLANTTYSFSTIKNVGWSYDKKGYYILINFISNDKDNSLRLYLKDITNQPYWTDDTNGAIQGVNDISSWMSTVLNPIPTGTNKNAKILRLSTVGTIFEVVYSISFSNVGSANATISADSGFTYVTIKPNETITFDAGAVNNYFLPSAFRYNGVGSELLIIYVC